MENILTSIIERLEDNALQLGLRYIDEEYGQVDMLDDESRDTYPVTFPAVLIDNAGESWNDLAEAHQKGTATINVNIYIDCYDDTHAFSNTTGKAKERMELVRSVTELLQNWTTIPGETGVLTRIQTASSTNNHGIKLYQVTFSTSVYESFTNESNVSGCDKSSSSTTPTLTVTLKK